MSAPTVALSSMCARDEHAVCKSAKATCGCACHGKRGQHAPEPNGRVTVESPVVWEDPPNGRGGRMTSPITAEQVAALKANPGRWARVKEYGGKTTAGSVASTCKKGRWPEVAEGFEFAGRRVTTGSALYAKWVGK